MPSSSTSLLSRRPYAAISLVLVVLVAALWPLRAEAQQGQQPRLELIAGADSIKGYKFKGSPSVHLELGAYLAALDAPFEIWMTRPDYTQPLIAQQALYLPNGQRTLVDLPGDTPVGWEGFQDFFTMVVSEDGQPIRSKELDFCPNAFEYQRLNDEGPQQPTYPAACFGNPFTKGMVWGIDEGWAASATGYEASIRLGTGTYELTLAVAPRYVQLFGIDPAASSVDLELTVKQLKNHGCPDCPPGKGPFFRPPARRGATRGTAGVPTVTQPDPSMLPDLASLPAWGITVNREGRGRETISFGATVWATGSNSMVVEGFRRKNEDLMDAYQYFYENGEPIGRAPVGSLEYDDKRGHQHWHFLQFARYSLLDATQQEVLRSRKEAFCLAPTDAIDLTPEGVDWNPSLGLHTNCGGANSLWVREILPAGWGDTYFQGLPGQSFNISDLPNGTYYIKVEANPLGSLFESDATNNVELREIILKGKPGSRTVEVPPWNGIDTEKGLGLGHGRH